MASTYVSLNAEHTAFRVIYAGKAYKRGVEYDGDHDDEVRCHLSALPHGNLRVQCSTAKKARYECSPDMAKNYTDFNS